MRRNARCFGIAATSLLVLSITAAAQADASAVRVTHALPLDDAGTVVDVYAGLAGSPPEEAGLLIDDFSFGNTEGPFDIDQNRYTVYLAVPGADDDGVLRPEEIVYAQDLDVPGGFDLSAVASLTEDGAPVIAAFVNDLTPTEAHKGRLAIRHTAAAPPVYVSVGQYPWSRYFKRLMLCESQFGDGDYYFSRYEAARPQD